MATITTGSEKQIAWAQSIVDDFAAELVEDIAALDAKVTEGVTSDKPFAVKNHERRVEALGHLREAQTLLESVTDARPVIDQRGDLGMILNLTTGYRLYHQLAVAMQTARQIVKAGR